MRQRFAELGGIRTAWREAGEGPPIVALHGVPTSSELFLALWPHLQGVRMIAPDLLGHGDTAAPGTGRIDVAAYERHLDAFLASDAAPERFTLVVHDFGGVLGLDWAARHPERIDRLVVMSTIVRPTARWRVLCAGLYALNLLGGRSALAAAMARTLKRARTDSALLARFASPWTRRRVWRGLDHFSARAVRRAGEALSALRVPALAIWGEDDDVFPAHPHLADLRALAASAPLEIVRVPDCGHWSPLDAPEEVATAVRRFMETSR
ncbi:MAG TPA: alpha/beta fold hydrolase [Myxococcaceae bacterium]